jgi:sulfatase modifying factor 1
MKKFVLFCMIILYPIILSAQEWKYDSSNYEIKYYAPMGYKSLPKKARHFFEGMKFIEGGTFVMGDQDDFITFSDNDSTLLVSNTPRRVTISSFFISDHEVTNAEYKEFVYWVINKTALEMLAEKDPKYRDDKGNIREDIPINWDSEILEELYYPEEERYYYRKELDMSNFFYEFEIDSVKYKINIYPDTLSWTKEFSYAFNDPMTQLYFSHPGYNDYPVVGVSYLQAQAYCHWRTERLNEDILLANKIIEKGSYFFNSRDYEIDMGEDGYLYPPFRLPTEAEWEYAAKANCDDRNNYYWHLYELRNEKGAYYANFGRMLDEKGVWLKSYQDDGAFYTNKAFSYPPNEFELYEMSGNVAEWVMDAPWVSASSVNAEDDLETSFEKVYNSFLRDNDPFRYDSITDREILLDLARIQMHDAYVLEKMKPARIVKGGSWADGPLYISHKTRTVFTENLGSSKIGFRVAMTLMGSPKKD